MRLEAKRRDGVRSKVWSARAAAWMELSKANPSSLHSGQREFPIAADRAPGTDMAVTRSRAVERARAPRIPVHGAAWRSHELVWTLAASLLVSIGLYLVHKAKSEELPEITSGLASKRLLNLNGLGTREEL